MPEIELHLLQTEAEHDTILDRYRSNKLEQSNQTANAYTTARLERKDIIRLRYNDGFEHNSFGKYNYSNVSDYLRDMVSLYGLSKITFWLYQPDATTGKYDNIPATLLLNLLRPELELP